MPHNLRRLMACHELIAWIYRILGQLSDAINHYTMATDVLKKQGFKPEHMWIESYRRSIEECEYYKENNIIKTMSNDEWKEQQVNIYRSVPIATQQELQK